LVCGGKQQTGRTRSRGRGERVPEKTRFRRLEEKKSTEKRTETEGKLRKKTKKVTKATAKLNKGKTGFKPIDTTEQKGEQGNQEKTKKEKKKKKNTTIKAPVEGEDTNVGRRSGWGGGCPRLVWGVASTRFLSPRKMGFGKTR